jgi:hypothetical protein
LPNHFSGSWSFWKIKSNHRIWALKWRNWSARADEKSGDCPLGLRTHADAVRGTCFFS